MTHLISDALHRQVVEALTCLDAHYSGSLDHQPPYVRLCRAALTSLQAPKAPEQGGWMPIETAPKHTEVMVYREDAGVMLATLTTCAEGGWLTDREQCELDEATLWQEDWWWFGPRGMCRMEGAEVPTHWQHLPSPPGQRQEAP